MTDSDKLMREAKVALERATKYLATNDHVLGPDGAIIYNLTKVLAAMVAQEEARFGKDTQA